jgi:DNA repair exonuclease SbcCD ATPase subunit/DNA repair exonuclease SbcCD nuclease subunit
MIQNIFEYSKDNVITYIIHLSDIHIRLDSSFEIQYQTVFKNTIRWLVDYKKHEYNFVSVITGDFFHVKDRLSSASERMAVDFLKQLSDISPVFMIMGNHDAMAHSPSLDTISTILHERNMKNVYYLKESGIYRYNNLVFIVNSVYDKNWIYSTSLKKQNQDDVLIHLYHGAVDSCQMDNGHRLSSSIKLKHFQGSDFNLLGDIHRHQFLSGNTAYAGSLISQNIGEAKYKHGFILWDILDRKMGKFIKISNPFQIVRVDVYKNGVVEYMFHKFKTLSVLLEKMRDKCIIRETQTITIFVYENPNITDPEIRLLFQQYLGREITIKRISSSNVLKKTHKIDSFKNESMTDEIKKYILFKYPAITDQQFYIDKISTHMLNMSSKSLNIDIQFKQLTFSHLFGYGKDNCIEFKGSFHQPTIRVITGKNSVGKSSIIDILTFVLFNRITRYPSGNKIPKEVIHENQETASVSLSFQFGSDMYEITKTISRNKPIRMTLKKNNENITQSVRQTTEKLVISIFGGYETFIDQYICLQKSTKNFKDKTPKEQKEDLYRLFGLDNFEKLYKIFNEQYQQHHQDAMNLETSLQTYSTQKFSDENIKNKEKDLADREDEYQQFLKELDILNQKFECFLKQEALYKYLMKEIYELEKQCKIKLHSNIQKHENPYDIQKKIVRLSIQNDGYKKKFEQISKNITTITKTKHLFQEQFNFFLFQKLSVKYKNRYIDQNIVFDLPFSIDDIILKEYQDEYVILTTTISDWMDEYKIYETSIQEIKKNVVFLESQYSLHKTSKYNQECECCMTNPFRKQKINIETQIKDLNKDVQNLFQKQTKIIENVIRQCHEFKYIKNLFFLKNNTLSEIYKAWCFENPITKIKNQFETLEYEYFKYMKQRILYMESIIQKPYIKKQIDILHTQITELEIQRQNDNYKKLDTLKSQLKDIKYNEIEKKYLCDMTQGIKQKANRCFEEVTRIKMELSSIYENKKIYEEKYQKYKYVKAQSEKFKILKEITHTDGFQLFYMRNALTHIEKDINTIISGFIDRQVKLRYENDSLLFQTISTNHERGLNFYGGMESFILDIVIKIVFSKYFKASRPLLFILDENISVMDEERLQNIDSLFSFLKHYFTDILVITHQPFLFDIADQTITISKDKDGYSYIQK